MNIRRTLFSALASLALIGGANAAILLEAEANSATGGGSFDVRTDRPGASGGKALIGWDDNGQWLEWKFEVPAAGEYEVTLRYAGGRAWTVFRELQLDGKVPAKGFEKFELPTTNGWGRSEADWSNMTIKHDGKPLLLKLGQGSHVLRLTSLGGADGNGSANLDAVIIHAPGEAPAAALKP